MSWLDVTRFVKRPIVVVEDHLYHTTDLLTALAQARPDLVGALTVCAVERPGPDTVRTVARWLTAYPALQVATTADVASLALDASTAMRVVTIGAGDLAGAPSFARLIVGLLRPGGVLVQDVQLSTLPFVPADRWWESIYVAATVRGMLPNRTPAVHFLSNKRGYAATFGRDLLDAGFDPRAVMDKSDLAGVVVPTMARQFDRAFPFSLDMSRPPFDARLVPLSQDVGDTREVAAELDLVLWIGSETMLGGRLVSESSEATLSLKADGHEAVSWRALIADRLEGTGGVAVLDVGARVGPAGAERAELTNAAARHIHALRGRLRDPAAIVTRHHAYRLADHVAVGIVRPRQ